MQLLDLDHARHRRHHLHQHGLLHALVSQEELAVRRFGASVIAYGWGGVGGFGACESARTARVHVSHLSSYLGCNTRCLSDFAQLRNILDSDCSNVCGRRHL